MNIGIFCTFFWDGLHCCWGSVHCAKLRCCNCAETSHIWVSNILEQLHMTADSPTFNNTPYHQPSANPYSFGMSAAHPPAVHFLSTPQFQAVQTSWAYSYTPHPSALPYQSPPNFTFTPYNSSGSHRYNTDLQLEMSPIIVPSQYRDNVPTDSPDTRGDQDTGSIHVVDRKLPRNFNSN